MRRSHSGYLTGSAALGRLERGCECDCTKLTCYFGERHRTNGTFVADALIDLYSRNEIAASILLRGMEGFGLKHHLRTDSSLSRSEDLPLTVLAVDTRPNIEAVLSQTVELSRPGLVTLERARLLSEEIDPVGIVENADETTNLTVYFGRHDRVYGVPAFEVICEVLHRRGIAGATVLLGVDGTAHGRRQRAPLFGRNAEVPMMMIAVGFREPDRPGSSRTRQSSAAPAYDPGAGPYMQA